MASLPSQYPTLSIHLSDLDLTPLITSSSSPSHLESLTSLTSSAIAAQTAARRARLGRPQRIMVEYPDAGPVILQSFLDPAEATEQGRDPGPDDNDRGHDASTTKSDDAPPVLVGLVVAGSSDDAKEARRAAARLESIGREFQREWAAQDVDPGVDDGQQ